MNILHIGKFYPPFHGGMENYLRDLAGAQCRQGHQVTVWVHNHQWQVLTSKTTEEQKSQVHIVRQKSLKSILFAPIMLGFNGKLKQLLQENKPDVIHLHWPNPSLFKLLLNRSAKKIPWVISWHSDMVTSHSSKLMKLVYWFIKPLESKLIKQASSLLVSTEAYAKHSVQLSKHFNKTAVIPLGMDTNEMDDLDLDPTSDLFQQIDQLWRPKKVRLLHIGRLTFYKNQQFLINLMPEMPEVQLLIAGEGQLHDELQSQINGLQLKQQVTLLGGLEWNKIHALFASCDVFCMASHDRAESFGVVLLEAMYHNKIILVPDTVGSGMRWLATNYSKGFVYKVNDSEDFIEKLNLIQQGFADIMVRPKQFNYPIQSIAESVQQHYTTILTGDKE